MIIHWFYGRLKVGPACGDITDVTAQNGVFVPDSQCNVACDGDPAHSCGGLALLNVYYWLERNIWPTPGNTGRFEASILIYSDLIFTCNPLVYSISVSRPFTPRWILLMTNIHFPAPGCVDSNWNSLDCWYVLQGRRSDSYIRKHQQQGTLPREAWIGVGLGFLKPGDPLNYIFRQTCQ